MVSQRIRELRKCLKLTQAEFAKKLHMSTHGIQKWEYGEVGIKEISLLMIETTFNVSRKWLRYGEGDIFLPVKENEFSGSIGIIFNWLRDMSEAERSWTLIELRRRFPEFEEWLKVQNIRL